MSETIDYFEDIIECKNCGTENTVEVVSTYSTKENETFNELVAKQNCTKCGTELKF